MKSVKTVISGFKLILSEPVEERCQEMVSDKSKIRLKQQQFSWS